MSATSRSLWLSLGLAGMVLLPALSGGALPPVSASAAEPSDPVLEVYRRSGMQEQLGGYSRNLETLVASRRDEIAPRMFQSLQKALRAASDSIEMDSTFLARFRTQLSATTTRSALTFLDSSVGKAVTAAERRSSTPEGMAGAERFFKEQNPEQGEPTRARLLRVLDTATGASDMMAYEMLAMNHAIAVALDAQRPPEERQGPNRLWTLIRQNEGQARAEAQQRALASFFYIYRAISKDELREYIRFATSDDGLDYHRVMTQLLLQSLMEYDAVISRVLVREMVKG